MNVKWLKRIIPKKAVTILTTLVVLGAIILPLVPYQYVSADAASDLYWFGGTGNWSDTAHWATATNGGGTTPHNAPTATNNVFFDANSFAAGTGTVTVDATANCLNMIWTGATNTPTFAGGAFVLNIYGSRTYLAPAAMTITRTGTVTFRPAVGTTKVVTSNGAVSPEIIILNGAGTLQLADKLTVSGTANLTLTAGTFDANTKEVALNGTAHTIAGTWTFATLTRNGTATKTDTLTLPSGVTTTCTTFAMIGNSVTNRLLVQSSVLGTAATITATNWTGTVNVAIMDITATNAIDLSAITGLSGDCGGNTNITFTTAAAQTWDGTTGSWSTAAKWTSRVPLPQDDVSAGGAGNTITVDMPRIGKSITFTGTPTVSLSNVVANYGSLTLASGMTYTHNNYANHLRGRGIFTITSSGKTVRAFDVSCPTGTYSLQDDAILITALDHRYGTIDLNNNNITSSGLYSAGGTRVLTLGNGNWYFTVVSAGNVWNIPSASGLTVNSGSSTIYWSNSGTNAQTFLGAGFTYYNVVVRGAGAYALTVAGNNTFNNFTVDASQAAKTIVATGTTQVVSSFQRSGIASTNIVTITGGTWSKTGGKMVNNTGTATGSPILLVANANTPTITVAGTFNVTLPAGVSGTASSGGWVVTDTPKALLAGATTTFTVEAGGAGTVTVTLVPTNTVPIALNYMSIANSTAIPASVWYAGLVPPSTDGGGNTGWIFTQVPIPSVTTNAITGLTMNAAGVTGGTFNGTIGAIDGTPNINTYFEYGLDALYGSVTPTIMVYASGAFTGTVPVGLTPGGHYHFRAVATNTSGTVNGLDSDFTLTMPTITTVIASGVTMNKDGVTGGNFNGNITNMGVASSTYAFVEYGLTVIYGTSTASTTRNAIGAFSIAIPVGLTPGETYHFRMNIQNGATVVNGDDQSFTFTMPTVTTLAATNIILDGTGTHATLRGTIPTVGVASSEYVYFQWGYSPAYGNTTPALTQVGTGAFQTTINHFSAVVPVYYRTVTQIDGVTVYGVGTSFTMPASQSNAPITSTTIVVIFGLAAIIALFVCISILAKGGAPFNIIVTAFTVGLIAIFGIIILYSTVSSLW